MKINSYSKVFNLNHKYVENVLDGIVTVSEKVDGSQFSMSTVNGELYCRSKGKEIILDAPDKLFTKAVKTAIELKDKLVDGYTYRCEYLSKPKHNALKYDRVPKNNLIVYDIDAGDQQYLKSEDVKKLANEIGLESVPVFFVGKLENFKDAEKFLDNVSVLGGPKIEGIVIKNYEIVSPDKKIVMAKIVSKEFQEVHKSEWKKSNPTQSDIITQLIKEYKTTARWEKAIQHLSELGELDNSAKDIVVLIKEIQKDAKEECEEEIKDKLFKFAWEKIKRGLVGGFPEYYKSNLERKEK